MILLFALTSSPEYSAGLHCDIWQVHVHLSVFGLALNREKGYLLPTEKNLPTFCLEDSVETSASYFASSSW